MKVLQLALLLGQCLVAVYAASLGKTLVVFDQKLTDLSKFEAFLGGLTDTEFDLLDVGSDPNGIQLTKNEQLLFSNVILFTTKSKAIELSPSNLLKFLEKNGNLIVLTSPEFVNPSTRAFLNELGIYPSPKNNRLIDHFKATDDSHTVVKLSAENIVSDSIVSQKYDDLKYQGSAALLSNSPLLIPVLQAPSTSYTKNVVDDDLAETNWAVGSQGYLVAGHQSLNNARVLWIGDDGFFNENPEFSKELIDWTFGGKNVLKINYVSHSHVDGTDYDSRPYKIKDDISYNISISLIEDGESKGFITDDLQLDVKLLDPYHRLDLQVLEELPNETIYGIVFKLPDHHGIFSFELNYNKPGYSYLATKDIKSIRHLANDEYLRSWEITNAWVYIVSSIVVFIGWFLFLWSFIFSSGKTTIPTKDPKKDK